MKLALCIHKAKRLFRADIPLPLDLYVALDAAGIDINELERKARNG